jgi:AraC-like DNA-binding protein
MTKSAKSPAIGVDGDMPREFAKSLAALLETARRVLDDDRDAAKTLLARASALLQVEIERRSDDPADDAAPGKLAGWQVNRLLAFVDANLDRRIHVADLARVAQRSSAYFCRAFKHTFGETPHGFLTSRRLRRASHLMLTSDLSLSEIAIACGLTDQAHLCRLFRRRVGQSPAIWRRERRATAGGTTGFVRTDVVPRRGDRHRVDTPAE